MTSFSPSGGTLSQIPSDQVPEKAAKDRSIPMDDGESARELCERGEEGRGFASPEALFDLEDGVFDRECVHPFIGFPPGSLPEGGWHGSKVDMENFERVAKESAHVARGVASMLPVE